MKKINRIVITPFLIIILSGCSNRQISLEGTRWEYNFGGGVKDYIEFKEGDVYESYSGEAMLTFVGIYYVNGDTINMARMAEVDNDTRFRPSINKALIVEGKLKIIGYYSIEAGEVKKLDFTPDTNYFFQRVN